MKPRWWLWTTLACAVVAVSALPLRLGPAPSRDLRDLHHRTIQGELREAEGQLNRLEWIDSLAPLAVAGGEAGESLVVAFPQGVGEDESAALRSRVANLRSGGSSEAVLALGFPSGPSWRWGGNEVHAGATDEGRPFCLSAREVPPGVSPVRWIESRSPISRSTLAELIGPCWVVARHGLPGDALRRWLEAGGEVFLTAGSPEAPWRTVDDLRSMTGRALSDLVQMPGRLGLTARALPARAQRCLAMSEESCAALVLRPHVGGVPWAPTVIDAPDVAWISVSWRPLLGADLPGVVDRSFLWALDEAFGTERFGAFWTSDLPVEEAFEAAFGIPLGRYVLQRGQEVWGAVEPGPAVTFAGWSGLLLSVALGLIVGAAVVGRRALT